MESSANTGGWDQFAENEKRFGITTDYDENIYTTAIDKSHPQYKERIAAAERKAREIERSQATTAHVAEERIMDWSSGNGDNTNEEDKYSGVRRQDFSSFSSRENKYTPPAKRAPTSQSSVAGAPIDPAIISSQVRAPGKKPQTSRTGEDTALPGTKAAVAAPTTENKSQGPELLDEKGTDGDGSKATVQAATEAAPVANAVSNEKSNTPLRPSAPSSRTISPQVKEGTPSAASTVERDVLNSFKSFASQQRQTADKMRSTKAKADKEVKLSELKKFANSFKLSTPVPTDLISIIAKDPHKQKEIQAKALQNVEDVARTKAPEPTGKAKEQGKEAQGKPQAAAASSQTAADTRPGGRAVAPSQYTSSPGSNSTGRHPNSRQSYAPPAHHNPPYRSDRSSQQHLAQQGRQSLGQRLRTVEQQKMSQPPAQPHTTVPEMRIPPTGPANTTDPSFGRRLSGTPGHSTAKLNPNSNEFKPNPFATSFNPSGGQPSASSSPRSAITNNVPDASVTALTTGQLIRRKTKAIDVKKCHILAHVKSIQAPTGRNWDDNDGIRPSYDTPPTWRQITDTEKSDSTMRLTYKELLDKQSFATPTITPNPTHANSTNAHHHQLPLHMQQGPHAGPPRHSPNMSTMSMHNQHGPAGYNGMEDHRMMPSTSAQSYASPRVSQQIPMAYPPAVSSPGQVTYNPQMMQQFMAPGAPQMGAQFRSFSNNHQFMPQQMGHMGGPVMMPPMMGQGMPQMPMYGAQGQFGPPNTAPQSLAGPNGFPSPGRPAAPMMAPQGSQQGQGVYGMSPSLQFQQPAYPPQQPGGQGLLRASIPESDKY